MEAKYLSVISWLQACVTAIFVVSSTLIISWINSHNFGSAVASGLVIIGSVVGIKLSELIVKFCINNLRFVRYLIFRRHFIEGRWFDVVLSPETKLIREYGLVEIGNENGSLSISGILFDCAHRRIGGYSSHLTRFDGKIFEYGYSRHVEHDNLEEASGLGEYKFTIEKPYPLTFIGSFFDTELATKALVRGFRITDKNVLEKIDSENLSDQSEIVQELAQQFLLEFPEYQPSKTSCEEITQTVTVKRSND